MVKKVKYSSQINYINKEVNQINNKWQAMLNHMEDLIQVERKLFRNEIKQYNISLQAKLNNISENEVSSNIANWDDLDLSINNEVICNLVHNTSDATFHNTVCTLNKLTNQRLNELIQDEFGNRIHQCCMAPRYLTRSRVKELKEMKQLRDELEYLDPAEKELEKQVRFRQDFLDCINKYKMPTYIFEKQAWLGYQEMDEQCKLIINYIKDPITTENDELWGKRLKDLEKNETEVYRRLQGDAMKLDENGFIIVSYIRELDKKTNRNLFVPLKLRKEITQYAHHNPYSQHFGWKQTFYNLESKFWWPDMKHDARKWIESCLVCLYTKGGPTHIAPMQIRKLPKTKEHIMADFVHCRDFYILVLIDYSSAYVMLRVCDAASAQSVSSMLLEQWIPILGCF